MPAAIATKNPMDRQPDRQKEMTGLEFVQGLVDGTLPLNTIAQTLGYDIGQAENGRVVITAEPNYTHLNPAGTVHGGSPRRCLDSAWASDSIHSGEGGRVNHTRIQDFLHTADHAGDRTNQAEGNVLNCGRPVGTAEGRIHGRQGSPARPCDDHDA